jgi:hypothetical protein
MAVSYLPGQIDLPQTAPRFADLLAQRSAESLKPVKPQAPCDVGLFGDSAAQTDLLDLIKK